MRTAYKKDLVKKDQEALRASKAKLEADKQQLLAAEQEWQDLIAKHEAIVLSETAERLEKVQHMRERGRLEQGKADAGKKLMQLEQREARSKMEEKRVAQQAADPRIASLEKLLEKEEAPLLVQQEKLDVRQAAFKKECEGADNEEARLDATKISLKEREANLTRRRQGIIQSDRKLAAERKDVEDKEKALRSQLAGLSIAREEAQLEKWNATERKEMEEIRKQVAHEMRRDQHGHDKLQSWAWEMQARDTFGDLTATRKCALQDLEVELPKMQALAAKVRSCGPCAVLIPIAKQQCRHPAHLPSSHILNC